MAETEKSRDDQRGSNKLDIKLGGGSGGGAVGVVVLLGGALATAAFVFGQKRWSSGKDNRHRNSSPEIDEKREKEHERIRKGGKEEVQLEKDVEADAISDDGFVIVKPSSEIPLLKKGELDKVVSDDHSKYEQIYIEDDSAEGESDDDGEITEASEREEDNGVEGDEIDDKHLEMEVKEKEFVFFCSGKGEINEEKSVLHPSPAIILNVDKEEPIPTEEVEGTTKNGKSEEAPQNVELNENGDMLQQPNSQPDEDDAKRANEEEVEDHLIDNGDGEATISKVANGEVDSEDGVVMDYGVDRRGDSSKWEALWQAEWPKRSSLVSQRVKLVSYEVGGKVREDSEAVINKYTMEMGMVKEDPASSTRVKMMVWALSVLSSLWCSWFFDMSFAKLCLVVFLTAFLLEIYGYLLINRQQAAKGETEKLGNM
ncbi:uncharacterized protein LOC121749537 isoform X2 [Salvia splendens]|uniref:uncharacterized protein LOC121749537 isoform X2 n=1 Tax=Salvia splendens TaxID=180675 RepID=UPI001C258F23|nr:uncharacterized protein LOC121749537 isoform X2 [Salvia splendens]